MNDTLRVALASVLCALMAAAAAGQKVEAGPAAAPAADALFEQVTEKAAEGKLTPDLVDLFVRAADARAREKLVPGAVSEEFWQWLAKDKGLHKALLVNLHSEYKPAAAQKLAELREKFPEGVDKYTHLALAFALVFGQAGDKPVRAGWARKHKDWSAVPAMADSFEYYLKGARFMLYPLDKLPWPVLVHVADNDIPMAEREWAVNRYAKVNPTQLGKIYYDVPYDYEGLKEGADQGGLKINKFPYTLPNILEHGGVCADRAYYSTRVLKSLGIPGMYDSGEGARGGHAWLAWISIRGNKFALADSGRFDFDKYYVGAIQDPLTRKQAVDRDAELVAAGVAKSYGGYLDALVACHLYNLVDESARTKATDLLKEAANRKNYYCAPVWRTLGKAVADGVLPRKQGEVLYGIMSKPFAAYPDLTYSFLEDILAPRLASSEEVPDAEVKANIGLLDKAFLLYEKAGRPDLAVKLRVLQGRYLEATANQDKALKLYVAASQQYVRAHFGFLELFDRALAMMQGEGQGKMRLRYLDYMANNVPQYRSDMDRDSGDVNPAFSRVAKAYADELKRIGKSDEAEKWESKLPKKTSG